MPGFPPEQKAALRHNDLMEKGKPGSRSNIMDTQTIQSCLSSSELLVPTFRDGRFLMFIRQTSTK